MGVTAVILVVVECVEVGLATLSKTAMKRGMSDLVYISYSNALAIFFLLLASLFFYRNKTLPHLTWPILFRIFLLALISCCAQMFFNYGIWYSSPTLASAMLDLVPAFTFLLALISRMEKLDMKAKSSWAKSIGTIVSIAGAITVSLYKGLPITKPNSSFLDSNLVHNAANYGLILPSAGQQSDWVIGGSLLAGGALFLSLMYIVQTWIMKDYPQELMLNLISCIFATIQSTTIAFLGEKDPNAWTLKPDVELITICYSAFFGVAIRSVAHTWACGKKGPVYVAMFKPLSIVVAVIMGVSFLGDTLYLGSLIGSAIIAIGFYTVIWGQAQEDKNRINKLSCGLGDESSPHYVHLLNNKNVKM